MGAAGAAGTLGPGVVSRFSMVPVLLLAVGPLVLLLLLALEEKSSVDLLVLLLVIVLLEVASPAADSESRSQLPSGFCFSIKITWSYHNEES